MIDIRKEIKKIIAGIIFIAAVILVIRFAHLNLWQVILLFCAINLAFMCYSAIKKKLKFPIFKFFKECLYIIIIVVAFSLAGRLGFWGFVLVIIGYALLRIIRRRTQYMGILRYVEHTIWGKPLDRRNWSKGEFKNRPKRKLVWRKKNEIEEEEAHRGTIQRKLPSA